MSESEIPPIPDETMLTITSSLEKSVIAPLIASSEPRTSAFMIKLSLLALLPSMSKSNVSSLAACCLATLSSRDFSARILASSFALFSSVITKNSSPALGTSSSPNISAGIEGAAELIGIFFSFVMARILPTLSPATIKSPFFNVPCCTSAVATTPRPLSTLASTIIPRLGISKAAFNSKSSA